MEAVEIYRARIKKSIYILKAGLRVHVSVSLGVSILSYDAGMLTVLPALADQTMFGVKEKGKDLVCDIFYETTGGGRTK